MPALKPLPPIINGFKVISDLGTRDNGRRRYLIAECPVCLKSFEVEKSSLRAAGRKGCGCSMKYAHRVKQIRTNIPTKLRTIYNGMKSRCHNERHKNYKNYGAKGIHMCEVWLNRSSAFFKWALSNGFNDNLTIDRIDASKGYSPENCQFITMQENIQKRRSITKLNPDMIKSIRSDFSNMTTRAAAKKWGIGHRHIMDIKSKKAWGNI